MPETMYAIIQIFDASSNSYDEEGEIRIGSYYQFVDANDLPLGELIGPYFSQKAAEKAAHRAFITRDF